MLINRGKKINLTERLSPVPWERKQEWRSNSKVDISLLLNSSDPLRNLCQETHQTHRTHQTHLHSSWRFLIWGSGYRCQSANPACFHYNSARCWRSKRNCLCLKSNYSWDITIQSNFRVKKDQELKEHVAGNLSDGMSNPWWMKILGKMAHAELKSYILSLMSINSAHLKGIKHSVWCC